MILQTSVLKKSSFVSSCTFGETSFVVNEQTGQIIQLDEVGSFLWTKINGSVTVNEIAGECNREFLGDREEIMTGILLFFHELSNLNLIQLKKET